jgi:hypothetical protein
MLNIARMSRVLTIAALITLSCHLSFSISSNGPLVALSRRVRRQVAITDTTDVWVARGDEAIELRVHTVFLATDATWVYTDMHMPVMEEILKGFLEIPIETLKRTLVAYEMQELESKDQYRKWFYTQVASVLAPHITTQHNILTCTGSISKAEIFACTHGQMVFGGDWDPSMSIDMVYGGFADGSFLGYFSPESYTHRAEGDATAATANWAPHVRY